VDRYLAVSEVTVHDQRSFRAGRISSHVSPVAEVGGRHTLGETLVWAGGTQAPWHEHADTRPVVDHDELDLIHLGGETAVVLPMYEYRRLRALERRVSAENLDAAGADAVLQGHDEWVAAGRPSAMSHEEFMAELLGGSREDRIS